MLTLQGATALSDFRISKLLEELCLPGLYALDAVFIHFVDLERDLTEKEFETQEKKDKAYLIAHNNELEKIGNFQARP